MLEIPHCPVPSLVQGCGTIAVSLSCDLAFENADLAFEK